MFEVTKQRREKLTGIEPRASGLSCLCSDYGAMTTRQTALTILCMFCSSGAECTLVTHSDAQKQPANWLLNMNIISYLRNTEECCSHLSEVTGPSLGSGIATVVLMYV